jgi:hypothetical protein
MTTLPETGQTIIFDKTPPGSYTRPGEEYRVSVSGQGKRRTFHFRSVACGSGTFDQAWAVARSSWRVVEDDA